MPNKPARTLLGKTSFTQPATVGGGQTVTHILKFAPRARSRSACNARTVCGHSFLESKHRASEAKVVRSSNSSHPVSHLPTKGIATKQPKKIARAVVLAAALATPFAVAGADVASASYYDCPSGRACLWSTYAMTSLPTFSTASTISGLSVNAQSRANRRPVAATFFRTTGSIVNCDTPNTGNRYGGTVQIGAIQFGTTANC